jgi:hypothetical protein
MCGVSININKTKKATEGNLCGEFVSRNLNHGTDVSRISANICRAVKNNPLDIPQLAFHLHERNYQSTIPIRSILEACKVPKKSLLVYIRTFYVLCELHKGQGLDLLLKSLNEDFFEEIMSDILISTIKTFGVSVLKDTFYSYLIKHLLDSISDKMGKIFDSAAEFDSSQILAERAEPDK